MAILNLCGVSFQVVVVLEWRPNFSIESLLAHCPPSPPPIFWHSVTPAVGVPRLVFFNEMGICGTGLRKSCLHALHSYLFTLGFLPQIPFKMTQSIHIALQKSFLKIVKIICFLTIKPIKESDCHYSDVINILFNAFRLKKNKWEIGLYFGKNEKNC